MGNSRAAIAAAVRLGAAMLIASSAMIGAARADAIARYSRLGRAIVVKARPITRFGIDSRQTQFGDLAFVGGIAVSSSDPSLAGMSSIRVGADRRSFVGIIDTGLWYSGAFARDDEGRLSGISSFHIAPIRGSDGRPLDGKEESDAESIAVRHDGVLVGFERDHRIELYPARNPQVSAPVRRLALPFPKRELRINRSLETIAVSPKSSPLAGATVTVAEMSINKAGDLYAGILDGPHRGTFFVHHDSPYGVSDGAFLPDGDLLLLERSVKLSLGFGVRIVRIRGEDIRPGATVTGKVIFSADLSDQIDNLEGLSVNRGSDGQIYLLMVSDDNGSILQRNLFLEFRLLD